MQRIDLPSKLVQSFLTVLRMQSYTKAAQVLNLSQPAVSQHVARLEEVLGIRLIERTRGVVSPTTEAKVLLPDLKRFDRSVEQIIEKSWGIAQGGQKTVRIATTSSLVNFILAPAIAEIRNAGTEIYPVLRIVADHSVFDMVRAGEFDLALTSMAGSDSALSCTYLLSDRPCLVCPDGHPLNSDEPIDLKAILPYKFVRPPLDTASNSTIEGFERMLGTKFEFAAEAGDLLSMEVSTRAGMGLLIVPALSAKLIAHSGLSLRPIDVDCGWRNCQLIRQQQNRPSPLVKQVIDGVRKQVINLGTSFPDLISRKGPLE